MVGELEKAIDQFLTDVDYRYDQRNIDPLRPLLPPNELWLRKDELFAHFKTLPQVQLTSSPIELRVGRMNAQVQPLPVLAVEHQNKEPLAALRQFSEQFTAAKSFSQSSRKVAVKRYWSCYSALNCARKAKMISALRANKRKNTHWCSAQQSADLSMVIIKLP